MNEKNLDYLLNQLKFTGFGEGLREVLQEKMEKQDPQMTVFHQADFGIDHTISTLQFDRSAESDWYFFNRYSLMVKTPQIPYPVKQTFYIHNHQSNTTLKEAYNLMSGRAVFKELTPKEGEKYHAWIQVDFKEKDKNDNFRIKQFHQNYGFDLEASLMKYRISELGDDTAKSRLIESLQRGNRQLVTFLAGGSEEKIFIEALPQFKSFNFYDAGMVRIRAEKMSERTASPAVVLPGQEKHPDSDQIQVMEEAPLQKARRKRRDKKTMTL